MLVQFSRENDRLAGENDRLRAGKQLVATDYQGGLRERASGKDLACCREGGAWRMFGLGFQAAGSVFWHRGQ